MIVLLDSGNSRLKAGWLRLVDGRPVREPAAAVFDKPDPETLDAWLASLPEPPHAAVGVNVAGPARGMAIEAALQARGCSLSWKLAEIRTLDLVNAYATPTQLGPDRWASLLGARARLPHAHPPFILASFGTATTIDTVGPDGVFPGGMILPGPALMRTSLATGTAQLPQASGRVVPYPTDTHQAIATGVAAAQAGALLRQWLAGLERYGVAPEIYVAGGGWPDVRDEVERLLRQVGTAYAATPRPTYLESPVLDGLAAWTRAQPLP